MPLKHNYKLLTCLAVVLSLSACSLDDSGIDISSLMEFSQLHYSILLVNTQIPGFQNTEDSNPTPINMSISGSAVTNSVCLIWRMSSSSNPILLTAGETSFITYSDGPYEDINDTLSEILYTSLCPGLDLNSYITFNANNVDYYGSLSISYPSS